METAITYTMHNMLTESEARTLIEAAKQNPIGKTVQRIVRNNRAMYIAVYTAGLDEPGKFSVELRGAYNMLYASGEFEREIPENAATPTPVELERNARMASALAAFQAAFVDGPHQAYLNGVGNIEVEYAQDIERFGNVSVMYSTKTFTDPASLLIFMAGII